MEACALACALCCALSEKLLSSLPHQPLDSRSALKARYSQAARAVFKRHASIETGWKAAWSRRKVLSQSHRRLSTPSPP